MYKSFDQAKEEVAKLREELYPNLFSSNASERENGPTLESIAENANELTDTVSNNEFTEDTSEAFASDDEVRGPARHEDEGDQDNSDAVESSDEVRIFQISENFLHKLNIRVSLIRKGIANWGS